MWIYGTSNLHFYTIYIEICILFFFFRFLNKTFIKVYTKITYIKLNNLKNKNKCGTNGLLNSDQYIVRVKKMFYPLL